MGIAVYISKAIKILIDNPNIDDSSLLLIFENEGIPKMISTHLLLFIPIAFSRVICKELQINFTDEYNEHQQNGKIENGLLSRNTTFIEVYEFSENFIKSAPNSNIILQIASRSPEFKIINESLLKGLEVNKIKFSSLHIIR